MSELPAFNVMSFLLFGEKMLIQFKGPSCWNCPLFKIEFPPPDRELLHYCALDGLNDAVDYTLEIKIKDPNHRPKECPFEQGEEIQLSCLG